MSGRRGPGGPGDLGPDGLDEYAGEPWLQALRAPGSEAELRGETEAVAAFRQASVTAPRRRHFGRLGAGGTAVVTVVALSSGVAAAAYTQSLPEPMQRWAHDVLGDVGVPPVDEPRNRRAEPKSPADEDVTPATPSSTPSEAPTQPAEPSPSSDDAGPGRGDPSAAESPTAPVSTSPTQTGSASPAPTTPPSATPTVAPVPVRPRLTASTDRRVVAAGDQVLVSGTVADRDGVPLADVEVTLYARTRTQPWTAAGAGVSDADGSVSLSVAVAENTALRLRAERGHPSNRIRIRSRPTVVASPDATTGIVATVNGAMAGDIVELLRVKPRRLVLEQTAVLDDTGQVTFAVPAGTRSRAYVVRVLKTPRHLKARSEAVLMPAEGS